MPSASTIQFSSMEQMNALGAPWWNDSCAPDELQEAVDKGATGATSNPVIVYEAISQQQENWLPILDDIIARNPQMIEDDVAWEMIHHIGQQAAKILLPVYEANKGGRGMLSMQVNPKFHPSPEKMKDQALQLASLAPNIMIKIPATAAGIAATEAVVAAGGRVNVTVCFTLSQAIQAAEAIERGLKQAASDGVENHPSRNYVTLMEGRLDDQLKRAREASAVDIGDEVINWAGIAVIKKAARLFKQRGYSSHVLAAAYRHQGHWSEIIGDEITQTIPYKWWKQFDASEHEPQQTLGRDVDEAAIQALRENFEDFRLAYEENALDAGRFVSYGPSVHTLNQFVEGYHSLLGIVRQRMLR